MIPLFNISNENNSTIFYVFINGGECYQSSGFRVTSSNNQTATVVDNSSMAPNNCSNLLNTSSTMNDDILLTFNVTLRSGSNYTIYIKANGSNSQIYSLITPDSKSSAVLSLNVANNFTTDYIFASWLQPATANGEIRAYLVMLNDIANQCLYRWWVLCGGCRNTTMGLLDWASPTPQCAATPVNTTFNTADTTVFINGNNLVLAAASAYYLQVVPINGYGWGNLSSTNFTTNQSMSGPVQGMTVATKYPNQTVTITWASPAMTNGSISQYIVWINATLTNTCIGWFLVNNKTNPSQAGTNGDPGFRTTCTNISGDTSIQIEPLRVSVTIVSSAISACSHYNVYVVAVNGYGWGNIATRDINTTQCPMGSFSCLSSANVYNYFTCNWTPPRYTSGGNVNYTVICTNSSTNIYTGTFPGNVLQTTVANVFPDINYTCKVYFCSNEECGPITSTSILIQPSSYQFITNITVAITTLDSSDKKPTSSQIYITIPYSCLTEQFGRIINFSLLVVASLKGDITNATNITTEMTYSNCGRGTLCPYLLVLPPPVSTLRPKRDTNTPSSTWLDMPFTIGDEINCANSSNCNGPLDANTEYQIGFRPCTSTGCQYILTKKSTAKATPVTIIVAVSVSLFIGLLVCAIGLIIWFRRRQTQHSDQNSLITRDSIDVRNFEEYYWSLLSDSCGRAGVQFFEIDQNWKELERQNKLNYITTYGQKDRYNNIKPYEHNVVQLEGTDGYINASRICSWHCSMDINDQCSCTNCYIVTQGPLGTTMPNKVPTIGDFWRMVYQYNVSIIVNLTKCVETYKEKCAQYWPEKVNGKETHRSGDSTIEVKLLSVASNVIYDERVLNVSVNGNRREVIQLHFTAWPDHGCPSEDEFMAFYNRFNNLRNKEDTVIVHCSAGVGRSGTFVLIDMELRKIASHEDKIDVLGTLANLRQSRCYMVQTEKQYIFVHAIILEYIKRSGLHLLKNKSANGKHIESKSAYINPSYE